MTWVDWLSLAVSVALFAYLAYALVRAERF
jgi:K+-transporting ATPase KdpF subunit